ncbi:MBG domain-containing protein [Clostridium sp.]|uniref:MBG domain-containing protein n=1 Tax=Clostridium sp. TaxID=1506 RepID=UPI0025811C46|nr:MBG domain-containing protein [Clostridium sp.]
MIKRKWYERVSAAALAAMLMVNGGGTNLQVKAEVVSVSEEDSTDAKKADRGETEEKESQDRDNKSKDYGEDGDVNKKGGENAGGEKKTDEAEKKVENSEESGGNGGQTSGSGASKEEETSENEGEPKKDKSEKEDSAEKSGDEKDEPDGKSEESGDKSNNLPGGELNTDESKKNPEEKPAGDLTEKSAEKLPKEVPAEIAPEVPENVEEAEPSTLVVTGFEELPEEILGQRLALGSSESDIRFPDTLTVTAREEKADSEEEDEEDGSGEEKVQKMSIEQKSESEDESADEAESEDKRESGDEVESANEADQPKTGSREKKRKLKGITWELDPEQSVYPEFQSGISLKEYFSEFDKDGNPVETEDETFADYEEANAPYSGAVYVYRAVLPEEDEDGNSIEYTSEEIPEICVLIGDPEVAAYELSQTVPEYTVQYEQTDRYYFKVFTIRGETLGTKSLYSSKEENGLAINDAIKDCKENYNEQGEIKLTINDTYEGNCSFIIKESCTIDLYGSYGRSRGTLFTIDAPDIEVTINNHADIGVGYFYENNYPDTSSVTFTNPDKKDINASFVIEENDNVDVSGADIRSQGEVQALVIKKDYEMTGGTVSGAVSIMGDATFTMQDGTVNGTIEGSGDATFIMNDGTLNGAIHIVPNVEIHGGTINSESSDDGYSYGIYLNENSKLAVSGGSISAKNTAGAAYGILGSDGCEVTLSGAVDITASAPDGKPASSMYYSQATKTLDATGVTSFEKPFVISTGGSNLAKISPFFNWVKGTENNISMLFQDIQFKASGTIFEVGTSGAYDNYKAMKYGNYIRVLDETSLPPTIVSGEITDVSVTASASDSSQVDVTYKVKVDGAEKEETITSSQSDLNNILSAILDADTEPGYTLTFGSGNQAFSGNVTVDTGENATIVLKGKLDGRCSLLGTGTLESYMDAAGFGGNTAGKIQIKGGSVISTSGSTIYLTKADLEVSGDALIEDQSSGTETHYAVRAEGEMLLNVNGGTIRSLNNIAIYQDRPGGSAYSATLIMTGGTVSGGNYGISRGTASKTVISGGSVSGTTADVSFRAKESKIIEKFEVKGEIPFKTIQLERRQDMNIDLTEAWLADRNELSIICPQGAGDDNSIQLCTIKKVGYRNFLDHIKLNINGAILVIDNRVSDTEADIRIYWQKIEAVPRLDYYENKNAGTPIYTEYLAPGGTPSKVVIDGMTNDGWKDQYGNVVTTENSLYRNTQLYPFYNVALNASVDADFLTSSSALITGTTDGTAVYYGKSPRFGDTISAAELEASFNAGTGAGKADVENGKFSISATELEPCADYTYYLAAKNDNADYSSVQKLTFKTTTRTLTADDFHYTDVLEITYNGEAYPSTFNITPNDENRRNSNFTVGSIKFKKKLSDDTYASDFETERPVNAGTYGVFVTTTSEKPGIERAEDLYIVDITIKKAKLDPNWFSRKEWAVYETQKEEIPPFLTNIAISGYGVLGYKLYTTDTLEEKVPLNSDGLYNATTDLTASYGQYSLGVTCTGGENVETQSEPIYFGEVRINRSGNYATVECEEVTYGNPPQPQIKGARDTSGGVTYLYSQERDGEYSSWNPQNPVGEWYVKAKIGTSLNYNAVESAPAQFRVEKAWLVPEIASVDSKTYNGNSYASGTLELVPAEENQIPEGDKTAVGAAGAVTGTFVWSSEQAGTTGVYVVDIKLNSALEGNYKLAQTRLSAERFGDAKIENAKITNVSVKQISELTYNGTAQRADVTTTGTTVDGSPITFVYAETEDALETAPQSEVPEFQNAGTHTVYYKATASNHDAVTDSFEVTIAPAKLIVTAEAKKVTYKEAAPEYSYTVSGFVNNETEEVLEGSVAYDCAYTAGSDEGEYDILPSGLTAKNGNYAIQYLPGKLTVEQAEPEFSLENLAQLNRIYDAQAILPQIISDSDGNMTMTILRGTEVLAAVPAGVGTYTVRVAAEAGKNYKEGSAEYTFEIRRAPLRVTAVDQQVTVGAEIPAYTVIYSGFAGNDDADVLSGTLQFTCEYTADSPVGTYAIVPSGLTSENYDIQFVNGALTVTNRASDGSGNSGSSSSGGSGSSSSRGSGSSSKSSGSSAASGPAAKGNWQQDAAGWKFTYEDDSSAVGSWITDEAGNQREIFAWVNINGNWWAFGADGYIKTGWAQDGKDNRWYQIDANTGMKTGWHFDEAGDKHWYYLNPVSGEMLTGWRQIDGKWYYFAEVTGGPLGSMYQNAQPPDGYRVGADGAWDGGEAVK